ncbi:MAG: hypothetical protein JO257_24255 [Deltaproteobacteria bacterium]|nr:hypothetical protein [Deltaproteobacteria bacterium]
MRILVTWGSTRGGTAGIADEIAYVLEAHGHVVLAMPARDAPSPDGYDAAIIGGAVSESHWHRDARHYLERHLHALRRIPTWLFSTGDGTDDSRELDALVARLGALDHVTFGSRLDDRVDAWAAQIAREVPTARPRPYDELHGHTLHRIVEYGAVAWAASAVPLVGHAVVLATIASVIAFGLLARRYQADTGARAPLAIAVAWAGFALVLNAIFFRTISVAIPAGFGLAAAWAAGAITAMTPLPRAVVR